MTSKVMNGDNWNEKWPKQSQANKTIRRNSKRTEKLKLSNSSKGTTPREKTLRRLESNERERMRMHSLNDAFQVDIIIIISKKLLKYSILMKT